MKEYFKPTPKKILGVIIFLFLFSFLGFFFQYISNPTIYVTGQNAIPLGLPLVYATITGSAFNNFNILYLIIDIIIFYLIICVLSIIFKGRKKENVPISNSGGGNPSPANQAQS
jgi:hypothetical protein